MNKINAVIKLTDGREIKMELYEDLAPITVANFIKLAKEDFYKGLCFHRVIPGFMLQGGGFVHGKALEAKNTAPIKGEFKSNGVANDLHHDLGVISMARTNVKDSASSQFFLCAADCGFLDGEYAGFGKTIDDESNKVILDISKVRTTILGHYEDVPVEPVVIDSVTIL